MHVLSPEVQAISSTPAACVSRFLSVFYKRNQCVAMNLMNSGKVSSWSNVLLSSQALYNDDCTVNKNIGQYHFRNLIAGLFTDCSMAPLPPICCTRFGLDWGTSRNKDIRFGPSRPSPTLPSWGIGTNIRSGVYHFIVLPSR